MRFSTKRRIRAVTIRRIAATALLLLASHGAWARAGGAQAPELTLTLGEAIRLAARNTPPMREATANIEAAHARAARTSAALLPQVGIDLSHARRSVNPASLGLPALGGHPGVLGPFGATDLRLRGSLQVFDPAAVGRWRAARADVTTAQLAIDRVADNGALLAAEAYVYALRARALADARLTDSSLAASLLCIADRQVTAGTAATLDRTRAETRLATAVADLTDARADVDARALALVRALGLAADSRVRPIDDLEGLTLGHSLLDERRALDTARRLRADIAEAETAVQAARLHLSAARAEHLPVISLITDDGAVGTSRDRLLNTSTLGVAMSMPLFDGSRRSAETAEERSALHAAEARRDEAVRGAALDVRTALAQARAADAEIIAARERVRLAHDEATQARARFTAGVANNADVIVALLDVSRAQTFLVDALTRRAAARVAIVWAAGEIRR